MAPVAPASDPFLAAIAFTLGEEGGLVDDPADPGGLTNMGLTLADLSVWERHNASPDDVRRLTKTEAMAIYRSLYWNALRGWALPVGVGLSVFDCGVNRGVGTSARILQRCCGATADGIIGPLTLMAAKLMPPAALLDALHAAQRADYLALADPTFEAGWLARCDARDRAAWVTAGLPVG